jgi:hypothetical protein
MRKVLAGTCLAVIGLLGATPVYAGGEIFDLTVDSCTGPSCNSVAEGATIKSFGPTAGKWIAEVFAASGECMRIFVSAQYADLQAVVVAPNGAVFRDDDGGGSLRPLVKIDPTPNNGWYTVSIGRFAGAADTGNFTVRYGRYNSGNVNCSSPTPPLGSAVILSKPAGAVVKPGPGEPGAQ